MLLFLYKFTQGNDDDDRDDGECNEDDDDDDDDGDDAHDGGDGTHFLQLRPLWQLPPRFSTTVTRFGNSTRKGLAAGTIHTIRQTAVHLNGILATLCC